MRQVGIFGGGAGTWEEPCFSSQLHLLFPLHLPSVPGVVTSLVERALGPHLQHHQLFHCCLGAPSPCLHQKIMCVRCPSSPGAPCPAWNPAPAVSPSSAPPLPPRLASPTAAPWSPDSWDLALWGSLLASQVCKCPWGLGPWGLQPWVWTLTKLGHLEPVAMIQLTHFQGCKDGMIFFGLHVRKCPPLGHLWLCLVRELRDIIGLSIPSPFLALLPLGAASFSGALPMQGTPPPLGSLRPLSSAADENLCLPKLHPSSQNGV